MGITDELKKRVTEVKGIKFTDLECLLLMMKRIDKAHTSALQCAHDAGYSDGYADGYGKTAEDGWVKLPRDEDGEPIHPDDKLDGEGDTTTVKGLMLSDNGWEMICDNGIWHDPKAFTHHHEPDTWERIIDDAIRAGFADGDPHDPDQMEASELVARCKALAGEDA